MSLLGLTTSSSHARHRLRRLSKRLHAHLLVQVHHDGGRLVQVDHDDQNRFAAPLSGPRFPPIRLTHLEPQLQRFDDLRDRDQHRGRVRARVAAEREPAELEQRLAVRRRRAGKDERRVGGFSTGGKMRIEMAARIAKLIIFKRHPRPSFKARLEPRRSGVG